MEKAKRISWEKMINKLNRNGETIKVKMGSPGSAQVTRCRLMEMYSGLSARTEGPFIFIDLA